MNFKSTKSLPSAEEKVPSALKRFLVFKSYGRSTTDSTKNENVNYHSNTPLIKQSKLKFAEKVHPKNISIQPKF